MLGGEVNEKNELVCNGKVKASLLITGKNGKQHIVEIVEEELVHYETEEGLQMRKRSRLADEIAKKNGFSGYSCISFLELENAPDERVIFDYINARIKAADTF